MFIQYFVLYKACATQTENSNENLARPETSLQRILMSFMCIMTHFYKYRPTVYDRILRIEPYARRLRSET